MRKALRLMSPAVRPIYERFFNGGLVLAAMMEDLPYLDNRVLPSDRPSLDGRQRLRIQYRLHASEIERRAVFLRQLKEVLKPFRKITLRGAKNNASWPTSAARAASVPIPKPACWTRKTGRTKWTTSTWWTPRSSRPAPV